VVGTGEAAGVVGSVGVPAVDELGGAQRAGDGGELADEGGVAAGTSALADLAVDGADVYRPAGGVVGDRAVDGVGGVIGLSAR